MHKPKERKKLSASKIKTLDTCSAKYGYKYLFKLPDPSNEGARIGSAFHDVAEILLSPQKYKKLLLSIIDTGIFPKSLDRLILKRLRKRGASESSLDIVKSLLLVSFKNDFWLDGSELQPPEQEFTLDTTKYIVYGLIDKYGIYTNQDGKKYAVIQDYKTQKEKFTSEEMDFNVQAICYLMAVKSMHPEIDIFLSRVDFILVKYPDDPVQTFYLKNENQISGFELYLEQIQKYADNFTPINISDSLAAKKKFPKDGEGFKGPLVCGRAKYKGHLKKDGSIMYHCPYKFGFDYYAALDKDSTVMYTSFEPIEVKDNSTTVEKRTFLGCEAFNTKKTSYTKIEKYSELPEDFDF